jgi:hypothetical protein
MNPILRDAYGLQEISSGLPEVARTVRVGDTSLVHPKQVNAVPRYGRTVRALRQALMHTPGRRPSGEGCEKSPLSTDGFRGCSEKKIGGKFCEFIAVLRNFSLR